MINSNEITAYTKNLSILFVEDHDELREDTSDILKKFFKTIDSCSNGQEALEQYLKFHNDSSNYYDIVLSDIKMPIMDGVELTEEIYKVNPQQAVIILSAHDETNYLLSLINLGIEQFIKKPIDYQELLTTFLNVSKKITTSDSGNEENLVVRLSDNFTYNKNSKSLNNNAQNVYLTKFEIIFMELLTSNIGKIYSNDDIVNYYSSVEENIDASNIRKLVSKLRKKLPEDSLESIYGIGYKFIPYYKN